MVWESQAAHVQSTWVGTSHRRGCGQGRSGSSFYGASLGSLELHQGSVPSAPGPLPRTGEGVQLGPLHQGWEDWVSGRSSRPAAVPLGPPCAGAGPGTEAKPWGRKAHGGFTPTPGARHPLLILPGQWDHLSVHLTWSQP